jgi:2-polyprenyl-3-methyl-5-hydroxy-6-metoxy-1,4-benzoquinol methylase
MDTNREWEKWGKVDPYFSVSTHDEYRLDNLNEVTLQKFFASGEEHVNHIMQVLSKRLGMSLRPLSVVDYGCGTGRLTLPLSKRADQVIGLDISAGMLDEARKNTAKENVTNVDYRLVTDDQLSVLPELIDLIHSFIVFQHIPRQRGEAILRSLLSRLRPGGFGVTHFTLASSLPLFHRAVIALRHRLPLVHELINLVKGKRLTEPRMFMECYSFPKLADILFEAGIESYFCERTNHGGYHGVVIYFMRPKLS